MRLIRTIPVLILVLIATPVLAQAGDVEVRTVDGQAVKGRFASLDAAGQLVIAREGGATTALSARRIVRVAYGTLKVVRHDHTSRLLRFDLAGGDVLFGSIIESTYDDVRISCAAVGDVTLPLDRVRMVTVLENTEGVPARLGADVPDERDVVFVRSTEGIDNVLGEVARFAQSGVYFEWTEDGESLFSFKKNGVVAVRLAEPDVPEPPATVWAVVYCRDGTRLSGALTRSDGGPLSLEMTVGVKVALKESEVVQIAFRNGDFVHLSDLEPASAVETPYIEGAIRYGVHRDASLDGKPATINDVHFPKAVCVHSRTEVTWDVQEGFDRFRTAIGLDGRVAKRAVKGAVSFTVLLDGKVLEGPVTCRAGEAPRWLENLDVTGGKKLTLRADFADNYHFNGWAVWGGAMLLRSAR